MLNSKLLGYITETFKLPLNFNQISSYFAPIGFVINETDLEGERQKFQVKNKDHPTQIKLLAKEVALGITSSIAV